MMKAVGGIQFVAGSVRIGASTIARLADVFLETQMRSLIAVLVWLERSRRKMFVRSAGI